MATEIRPIRNTRAGWTALNPVLDFNTTGYETDTANWKLGDGTKTWVNLPYRLDAYPGSATVGEISTPAQKVQLLLWGKNTPYLAGDRVVNPDGSIVTALAPHYSGSIFDPRKWSSSNSDERVTLDQYVTLEEPNTYQGVTFTIGTTAPSWISTYILPTQQGARFTVHGPPLVSDGQTNASYWASWNGSDPGSNVVSHEESMFVQGPYVTVMVYVYGDMDIQAMVDGRLVKPSWSVFPNTAGFYFATLEFTDDTSLTKVREIRWFYGQCGIYQYVLGPGQDMWPSNTRRYTFGIAAADSYYHGAGATTEGTISGGTLAHELSIMTGGRTRTINGGAVGGSGYRNAGTGTTATVGPQGQTSYGSSNRKAKFALWASQVDCIIIGGGANDADDAVYSLASVVAAAQQCWTDYAALAPGKPLIVTGVEAGVFPWISAKLDVLNAALKTAALAHPNVTAYIDDRAANLNYGTGKINGKTGDGIADVMTCSDGTHLSRFGNRQVTRQRTAMLGKVVVTKI